MIMSILEHTPSWVFAVFFALLLLGASQTRTRDVSRARAIGLPIAFVLLSLAGVMTTFTLSGLAVGAWLVGVGVSTTLGGPAWRAQGASWSADTQRVRIPGSWWPLILILGLFTLRYTAGTLLAIHPALAGNSHVALPLSAVYGAVAGLFWARTRSLLALSRQEGVVSAA